MTETQPSSPPFSPLPRHLQARVTESLAEDPVVIIHGPRQCGKSTLARQIGDAEGYEYLSFDNKIRIETAQADPIGFVADLPDRVILDEVQHVPELFTSLKLAVDEQDIPGRFLLTGSSNILLVPKLADSLAGRMSKHRLYPLSQAELANIKPDFVPALFRQEFKPKVEGTRLGIQLAERIIVGGFPRTAVQGRSPGRWYRDYAEALVQRDLRDLSSIRRLDAVSALLKISARHTAQLLNASNLATSLKASHNTVNEYIATLSQVFLMEKLRPWHSNQLKHLIKTPKLHMDDTGLACGLLEVSVKKLWEDRPLFGRMLETFVYQELRKQASWLEEPPVQFSYFRDKSQAEVDIVLERDGQLVGVEVKAAATVTRKDFRGLRKLQDALGNRFVRGIVLYDGSDIAPFGKDLAAVPISCLWS